MSDPSRSCQLEIQRERELDLITNYNLLFSSFLVNKLFLDNIFFVFSNKKMFLLSIRINFIKNYLKIKKNRLKLFAKKK